MTTTARKAVGSLGCVQGARVNLQPAHKKEYPIHSMVCVSLLDPCTTGALSHPATSPVEPFLRTGGRAEKKSLVQQSSDCFPGK